MHRGHIKTWRKIIEDEIFYKAEHLQLFLYLLIRARWEDGEYRGTFLERGQLSIGRKVVAAELGQKETTLYKRLKWLEKRHYIEQQSNNKMTIITICNYSTYQDSVTTDGSKSNIKVTTKGQQSNTIEEVKELKKVKEVKYNRFSFLKNKLGKEVYKELEYDIKEHMKVRDQKNCSKSQKAMNRYLNDLEKFSGGDIALMKDIIFKSYDSGWKGLFELKSGNFDTKNDSEPVYFKQEKLPWQT